MRKQESASSAFTICIISTCPCRKTLRWCRPGAVKPQAKASDTARDISNRYHDILSSPTLRGLESVRKIVSEAIVLEDIVRNHVEDRQGRIEKRYHQRKRDKGAKPVGEYIHNVSLEELREQHTEDWLKHTGKDVEYASYDASRAEIRSQLNKKEDFFTIDTQLAPEAREAIRKTRFADKPLSSADLSRLLCSDDTVDFTLTQPPADEDEDEDIYLMKMISRCPHRRPAYPTASPPF
ncbi:uncharacterized protein FPRO_03846 [Fusarium proliferatum ET1]|uniref:Uncharacterized protein n=1 Tax=Fusarium proliferatum (strain ET1) TaxID=1227346 RepID=A0A1L7V6Z2_FUSPR|nr:uncharacterized protein FPRO_03846 [Fusarium proliferatum ET1]CZR35894.1 uncharacterized protein FPRO_03846 [Fusarium proliferatum ET1]